MRLSTLLYAQIVEWWYNTVNNTLRTYINRRRALVTQLAAILAWVLCDMLAVL